MLKGTKWKLPVFLWPVTWRSKHDNKGAFILSIVFLSFSHFSIVCHSLPCPWTGIHVASFTATWLTMLQVKLQNYSHHLNDPLVVTAKLGHPLGPFESWMHNTWCTNMRLFMSLFLSISLSRCTRHGGEVIGVSCKEEASFWREKWREKGRTRNKLHHWEVETWP